MGGEIVIGLVIFLAALGVYYWKHGKSDIVSEFIEEDCPGKKKSISEPVLSFVRTVKENPKRFTGTLTDKRHAKSLKGVNAWIYDRKTKESFRLKTGWFDESSYIDFSKNRKGPTDWLTASEVDYLIDELTPLYNTGLNREARYKSIIKQRAARNERRRLVGVYCNE